MLHYCEEDRRQSFLKSYDSLLVLEISGGYFIISIAEITIANHIELSLNMLTLLPMKQEISVIFNVITSTLSILFLRVNNMAREVKAESMKGPSKVKDSINPLLTVKIFDSESFMKSDCS